MNVRMGKELAPLLQEFIARKEQILNLELRTFITVLIFQFVFLCFFAFRSNRANPSAQMAFCLTLLFLTVLIIAINAKMGLVSKYLAELEAFFAKEGALGLVWEREAVPRWIFVPGNAFTLASAFCVTLIFGQLAWALFVVGKDWLGSAAASGMVLFFVCTIMVGLVIKSITVDFGAAIPKLF